MKQTLVFMALLLTGCLGPTGILNERREQEVVYIKDTDILRQPVVFESVCGSLPKYYNYYELMETLMDLPWAILESSYFLHIDWDTPSPFTVERGSIEEFGDYLQNNWSTLAELNRNYYLEVVVQSP
jgi:hypothetical protein